MLAYAGDAFGGATAAYADQWIVGAVAQLGERDTGSVEVRGSSPLSSTIMYSRQSQRLSSMRRCVWRKFIRLSRVSNSEGFIHLFGGPPGKLSRGSSE
jgi:hypothetical protein